MSKTQNEKVDPDGNPKPHLSNGKAAHAVDAESKPIKSPTTSPLTGSVARVDSTTDKFNTPELPHVQQHTSFLSKLIHFFVPCISPSAHIESGDLPPKDATNEKAAISPENVTISNGSAAQNITTKDSQKVAIPISISPPVAPSADHDAELALPPTPTTPHLLPPEETEGMTSGAVQAPGSKGDSPTHEKPHPPINASADGDESEGTSYTEDEEVDEQEDEEDRLILNGGSGIPIGSDGVPRPLLPPMSPQHVGRKCLVLDLDETLVHSSFKSISQADYVVPVEIEYHWHNVYVIKRPGVDHFLKKMGEIYEIVVFTASLSKYADPVLDKLDIHQVVSHRLFRESCYNHRGNYVKDLSQLGRPIADTIILDNSPASYIFHPNNAVPVSSWFNDPHDTELTDLVPFLADLSTADDVRGILDGAR